ncbi:MAG: hypothetical protein K6E30_07580 [Lachnospiraceae bacterium]|nr:hypothetical protein [Lachnospiraceae bacterium]
MIELLSQEITADNRKSSKGNQLKWRRGDLWYKADYAGYEGLAEYMVSGLLKYSSLSQAEYTEYETEQITYKGNQHLGCRSRHFLSDGEQLITIERLFRNAYGESLYESIFKIQDVRDRLLYLCGQVERIRTFSGQALYATKKRLMDYRGDRFYSDKNTAQAG